MWFLDYLVHRISIILKMPLLYVMPVQNAKKLECYPSIDVVIPVVEKDIMILELCINSIKKYSLNPIRNFYIVSPENPKINEVCTRLHVININELNVLPLDIETLRSKVIKDKVGWFIQQFIKLNSNNIPGIGENYLIFDADTILLREQYFINGKYSILKFADEFHLLYRITNYRILKFRSLRPISFICHHMLFNKQILSDMKKYIEQQHENTWVDVILEASSNNYYYFSEYELYSQYVLHTNRELFKINYWFNKNSNLLKIDDKNKIERYYSVSYHNYKRD